MCQYANEREDDNVAIERWADESMKEGMICQLANWRMDRHAN